MKWNNSELVVWAVVHTDDPVQVCMMEGPQECAQYSCCPG